MTQQTTPSPIASGEALKRVIECAEILNKRPHPMCRDCADEDGICPHDGLSCDMRKLFADARAELAALAITEATITPSGEIATWQSRALGQELNGMTTFNAMKDEIADLRAALAQRASAPDEAVAMRDAALEEAAEQCDELHDTWRWDDEADSASGPRSCAAAIRALKSKQPADDGAA